MATSCDAKMELMLGRAARGFVRRKAQTERERRAGADLRFLFARLGVSLVDLESLSLATHGREIAQTLRERLLARLTAERSRLRRLAGAGSAAYDANRHLAVRAAIRWIEAPDDSVDGAVRLSGTALNARFRRRRLRTACA